nr:MAG TPA: nucelotide kinase [Caudoviricetes sp.]
MRKATEMIRPKHYVDRHGHDLFFEFERGHYPAVMAIGFCYLNMVKYERRAGKKTADPTEDLAKARTYFQEYEKLLFLKSIGEIHDQGIDLALNYEDFKKRKEIYLKRLDRIEEDIKSGRAKR